MRFWGRKERIMQLWQSEQREDHAVLEERKENHVVVECSFLPRALGSRRDFAGKKRGERTLLGGP